MRLAVTADLHWGMSKKGDAATRELAAKVAELQPDVFALAGDIGERAEFRRCLSVFSGLTCPKLLVPGNHDLWTRSPYASAAMYRAILPATAAEAGFQYLDLAPFVRGNEAVLGSINWYDYSFADPELERQFPDVRAMYAAKRFPHGRHNDGQYVQLGMSDEAFTTQVVDRFQEQLQQLHAGVERVIAIQHHPPVRELFYPTALTTPDQRFWLAYTGNRRMQEVVLADRRITYVICGHTHAACEATIAGKRCLNIGGDYGWKRLLLIDTDTGDEQAWEFGTAR